MLALAVRNKNVGAPHRNTPFHHHTTHAAPHTTTPHSTPHHALCRAAPAYRDAARCPAVQRSSYQNQTNDSAVTPVPPSAHPQPARPMLHSAALHSSAQAPLPMLQGRQPRHPGVVMPSGPWDARIARRICSARRPHALPRWLARVHPSTHTPRAQHPTAPPGPTLRPPRGEPRWPSAPAASSTAEPRRRPGNQTAAASGSPATVGGDEHQGLADTIASPLHGLSPRLAAGALHQWCTRRKTPDARSGRTTTGCPGRVPDVSRACPRRLCSPLRPVPLRTRMRRRARLWRASRPSCTRPRVS